MAAKKTLYKRLENVDLQGPEEIWLSINMAAKKTLYKRLGTTEYPSLGSDENANAIGVFVQNKIAKIKIYLDNLNLVQKSFD